ncbi:hypothetical protein SAMN05444166_2206 [Singulisphaera sp. GP187]|uniref:hypothetical protein n=1 Tax=Singulisphaera sp. GP187 TaxID=1882752 RepID=UPI0009273984|nr:hypothetical protein [Singulisphaera sp. GP187]SIO05095.1 hypothetical protein SAMN05444166_2206 [Singulisphaera sp. GP187]
MSKFVCRSSSRAGVMVLLGLLLACMTFLGCGSNEAATNPATAGSGPESSAQDLAKKRFDDTSPAQTSQNR